MIVIIISFFSHGTPILFKQKGVGKDGIVFNMYKFRSMKNNTPGEVATHLLDNPRQYNTLFGGFLRKYSIDEFPQLFNILKGEMVFIGHRPALVNQEDLNELRRKLGTIHSKPGVTGWAQVNGRDKNTQQQKVEMELYYLNNKNLLFDLKIILLTIRHFLFPKNIYPD